MSRIKQVKNLIRLTVNLSYHLFGDCGLAIEAVQVKGWVYRDRSGVAGIVQAESINFATARMILFSGTENSSPWLLSPGARVDDE
jgi:hypothetical protein